MPYPKYPPLRARERVDKARISAKATIGGRASRFTGRLKMKLKGSIKSCSDMPRVTDCTATECSYNMDSQCLAIAITVGDPSAPRCDTFFNISRKGGIQGLTGGVGACKVESCDYNSNLGCVASDGIEISTRSSGDACCMTYTSM